MAWPLTCTLCARLPLWANHIGLPLLALPPLLAARLACRRVLAAPGVERPLAGLHSSLSLAQ